MLHAAGKRTRDDGARLTTPAEPTKPAVRPDRVRDKRGEPFPPWIDVRRLTTGETPTTPSTVPTSTTTKNSMEKSTRHYADLKFESNTALGHAIDMMNGEEPYDADFVEKHL